MGIKEQFENPSFKDQRNDCCWSSFYTWNQPPAEPIIPSAEHVEQLRLLGVLMNPKLSMGDHIDRAVSSCASQKNLLCARQGLTAFVLKSCILLQGRQLLPPCNMPPRRGGGLPPRSSGTG